jgi:PAS domain S-box-containing protein
MEGRRSIHVALLGWSADIPGLLEALKSPSSDIDVVGLLLTESGPPHPQPDSHLPFPLIRDLSELPDFEGEVYLLDLRPEGSPPPQGLSRNMVWVPPQVIRWFSGLCPSHRELIRYKGVVESAKDAVVTIDEQHRIVFFNRAAEEMFGYSKEEVVGKDLSLLIPPPHRDRHREYVRRYVETRRGKFINHTVELEAQRRSGESFPISISFSVAEEGGQLLMTAILRDLSEFKALERRALQNERLVSIGQALSFVTHEIRNPLMVIGGFSRNLCRCEGLGEEDRRRLEIIVKEVQRLEGLLAEIQDFTKPLQLKKEPVELSNFLGEIVELFRKSEASERVTFSLSLEGSPVVQADPDRLRQVIYNLLKNALEAIPEDGRVTVATRQENGMVLIEIEDTGEGIDPQHLEEIFEPFVTTKKGGSGLGLPLCRKIIREHGGEISLTPGKEGGTCVQVRLPATEI